MTNHEYAQIILQVKKEGLSAKMIDEKSANEAAQLISGSFTYLLYEALRLNELNSLLNMDEKDNTILDFTPDEGDIERAPKVAGLER